MSKVLTILILIYSLSANLIGQDIVVEGNFIPYETYYIGMIDLGTGTTNVPLFNFLLKSPNQPTPYDPAIQFHAQFKFEILSPELGFPLRTTLLDIQTAELIEMNCPIYLDNTNFNLDNTTIVDGGNE